jgi:hypothetical protein
MTPADRKGTLIRLFLGLVVLIALFVVHFADLSGSDKRTLLVLAAILWIGMVFERLVSARRRRARARAEHSPSDTGS